MVIIIIFIAITIAIIILCLCIVETKLKLEFKNSNFKFKIILLKFIRINLNPRTEDKTQSVIKKKLNINGIFTILYGSINNVRYLFSKLKLNIKVNCTFFIFSVMDIPVLAIQPFFSHSFFS
jgi:hypothetical protein